MFVKELLSQAAVLVVG